MSANADQQSLKLQVTATVGALCLQGVQFNKKLKISGCIVVTADDNENVFINIDHTFNCEARSCILGPNSQIASTNIIEKPPRDCIGASTNSKFGYPFPPSNSKQSSSEAKQHAILITQNESAQSLIGIEKQSQNDSSKNVSNCHLLSPKFETGKNARFLISATKKKTTTSNDEPGSTRIVSKPQKNSNSCTSKLLDGKDVKPIINDEDEIDVPSDAEEADQYFDQTPSRPKSTLQSAEERKRKNEAAGTPSKKKPRVKHNNLSPLSLESQNTLNNFKRWLIIKQKVKEETSSKYESNVKMVIRVVGGAVVQLNSNTVFDNYFLPALNKAKQDNSNSSMLINRLNVLTNFCEFALETLTSYDEEGLARYEQLKSDIIGWKILAREQLKQA